jgi:hypothetical protein
MVEMKNYIVYTVVGASLLCVKIMHNKAGRSLTGMEETGYSPARKGWYFLPSIIFRDS